MLINREKDRCITKNENTSKILIDISDTGLIDGSKDITGVLLLLVELFDVDDNNDRCSSSQYLVIKEHKRVILLVQSRSIYK